MTIDEVRKLDTHKAILFIRGEDPVLDKKYNIKRHPNIKLTTDGKAKPYIHKPQGAPDYALPDLPYAFKSLDDYDFIDVEEPEHELSEKEKDMIIKHMWPVTPQFPKSKEGFILTFIDKHCALAEAIKVLKKNIHKKKVWRYAYIFFAMIILKINKGNN